MAITKEQMMLKVLPQCTSQVMTGGKPFIFVCAVGNHLYLRYSGKKK